MMKKRNWKNPFILLITAIIWGFAFAAQSAGMEHVGCFTFNFLRNLLGGLVLIPVILIKDRVGGKRRGGEESGQERQDAAGVAEQPEGGSKDRSGRRTLVMGGVCCGIFLCLATNLQQMAILHTTVGKAGFITALYIVFVPVLGLFLKRKCGVGVWIGIVAAVAGFYLLSVKEGFRLERADILLLSCAVLFSCQILTIDHFSPMVDGVKMACIQFFVCGILSGIPMLFTETLRAADIRAALGPILYAGVLSCGVAYTLQIVGQKNYNPTVASLIMSLEAVFSVLAGWLVLGQVLTGREIAGCILIFGAVVLAQLSGGEKKENGG